MKSFGLLFTISTLASAVAASAAPPAVNYDRDIRPILANNCYKCHGPDGKDREAGLRRDVRDVATKPLESGDTAIVPGKPGESELVARINSTDDDQRMPPPKSNKRLTEAERDLLKRWIAEGAKFDRHWSYQRPERGPVPQIKVPGDWPQNPIDSFILARLRQEKLLPSPQADKVTLIRRLNFDLIGLPPSPEQVAEFTADSRPEAYEKLVDGLLASPHYGERMALIWLDLVRYADSGGYHSDNERSVWPYRDYVIAAFNDNKPFDRFTIEQLAGDLLPEANRETRIASGYNRLLQTTEEGGAQAKEYTAKYAADRVRNLSNVWLGSTMGCCECHDHKFDPFKTHDFYSMEAFFADVQENAIARHVETPMPTADQAAEEHALVEKIAAARKPLDTSTPEIERAQVRWEETTRQDHWKSFIARAVEAELATIKPPVYVFGKMPPGAAIALHTDESNRSESQRTALAAYYRSIAPALQKVRSEVAALERKKAALVKTFPETLIATAVEPRTVRILPRGNWLDDSGEIVSPAMPAFLPPLDVHGRRANRLDLARWLVDRQNPLVARVFVNRVWAMLFGQGIVKTSEDFGSQGAAPTHPELLNWLAVEFIDSGWDVKHLVKLIVSSAAYQQSSAASPELRAADPDNRWVARQGRFRLDAELVRDNALAISGLLSLKIGGPSVKPYQPAGYWAYLNFPIREWKNDSGENQYRRGLYTFWQRTFLHPSLKALDAPTREECTAARTRSNTPLQSLVLLNDPTYVEAARMFAVRIMQDGGAAPNDRIDWAFHRALARGAKPAEAKVLLDLFENHRQQFGAAKDAAKQLLAIGDAKPPADLDPAELAAWTSVARAILNLHETITRN
ncbi:MAG TPA: PSD1 and planctomycete cytochrome C domain-containing protein [Pirellulales bacterium]|nr:PSD1 and planctomycete cytochrome C domain-containing protein [Pirellulales bacterium]